MQSFVVERNSLAKARQKDYGRNGPAEGDQDWGNL
jgi:hypothetical protein